MSQGTTKSSWRSTSKRTSHSCSLPKISTCNKTSWLLDLSDSEQSTQSRKTSACSIPSLKDAITRTCHQITPTKLKLMGSNSRRASSWRAWAILTVKTLFFRAMGILLMFTQIRLISLDLMRSFIPTKTSCLANQRVDWTLRWRCTHRGKTTGSTAKSCTSMESKVTRYWVILWATSKHIASTCIKHSNITQQQLMLKEGHPHNRWKSTTVASLYLFSILSS